jgi:multiple sugar transport system substrate-binding protein
MIRRFFAFLLVAICVLSQLTGCTPTDRPASENPVTLTIWHVYGSQTKSPFNTAIDEFNNTVGKENGITVNVVSVTSSSAIDKALAASVNGEPGAEELPDLFTAYPRVAQIVGTDRLLAWDQYFSEQELSAFKQEFLEEGYFDSQLLMLPIAKSTEALYLNKTLFADFSAQTGVSMDQLQSYEGLFDAANIYFDWSGGKHFVQLNDFYHYALLGTKAYGGEFIRGGKLRLDDPAFETVWKLLARTAIYGGICLDDGYAATRWKTVEIISNIGSTADIL